MLRSNDVRRRRSTFFLQFSRRRDKRSNRKDKELKKEVMPDKEPRTDHRGPNVVCQIGVNLWSIETKKTFWEEE